MKKTLALVLALAMVFSTITVAFAEGTLSAEAQIVANLGMLKGETGTVDAAYTATAPTRLQSAVMFLRLKGLEKEALAYTGEANFADGNIAWAEGSNLLAYLKANPQLGWAGDGTNFNPNNTITAKEYYKVLLEALGYKQTVAGVVVGDFTWDNVLEFAALKGLSKVATVANYTVNDLAIATVEALKLNVKDTEAALYKSLVTEEAAVAAGLVEEAAAVTVAIDEVEAIGNTVVQVEFDEDVDAASAGKVANYAIEGLAINEVVVAGSDTVRLYTEAQTPGKLYTLTSGDQSVKFAGLAKVSDGPQITDVIAEDVEEVVVTFDRNLDFASATDVATWEIKGITVVKAEISASNPEEVTLTTEGLKDGEDYDIKAMNIKSIDLVNRKTTTDDFDADYDVTAPKIDDAKADTNERIIVWFNEEVTEESAEDLANYSVKVDETDGAALDIISIEWDDDDENNVEITTEPMEENEDYKITISNIADQRKVANVMTKSYSKTFDSVDVDDKAPELGTPDVTVLSPTQFVVLFEDESRLDEETVLDAANYELENDDNILDIEKIEKFDSGEYGDTAGTEWFKAIFTVEEMANESTELTYVDILDEFGNAMGEDSATFTPNTSDYDAAKLSSITVNDENTIILAFDKELNEDSAENIANYTLDGNVGTPTKAEYEFKLNGAVQDNQVRLTVNDLVEGKEYALVIDGLLDAAGNDLKVDERSFFATGTWNGTVELKDADALNKYVVALAFGEEVDYVTGSYVSLSTSASSLTGEIKLYAKAMAKDDEVIEFSDYGTAVLTPEVTYFVYNVYGVTDLSGDTNATFTVADYSVKASASDEPEYAEFKSIEQVDADTVKVVMSKNVVVSGNFGGWTIEADGGDAIDETVYFRGTMVPESDYTLNLYQYLKDEHGIPAVDDDDVTYNANFIPTAGNTTFEADKADTSKPEVDDVTVYDRKYIEVRFDESIDLVDATDFEIVNLDMDEDDISIASVVISGWEAASSDNYEGKVIQITLNEALEGRYEYELRLAAGAVTDFNNNTSDEDTFTFDGTNRAEHE